MRKDIKVSCVIPTWQSAHNLHATIDALRTQSLKQIEIIIIDDASTDSTSDLLMYYKKKDSRIVPIIMDKRYGAAVCRNLGNKRARSSIIMVNDAGDISYHDRAKHILDIFNNNSSLDIYSSACVEVDCFDQQLRVNYPEAFDGIKKPAIFHTTMAYKKEVTGKIKYREGNLATDQYEVFLFEALKAGFKIDFTSDVFVKKLESQRFYDLKERYIQRVKNYKEFGVEIPTHLKEYENANI